MIPSLARRPMEERVGKITEGDFVTVSCRLPKRPMEANGIALVRKVNKYTSTVKVQWLCSRVSLIREQRKVKSAQLEEIDFLKGELFLSHLQTSIELGEICKRVDPISHLCASCAAAKASERGGTGKALNFYRFTFKRQPTGNLLLSGGTCVICQTSITLPAPCGAKKAGEDLVSKTPHPETRKSQPTRRCNTIGKGYPLRSGQTPATGKAAQDVTPLAKRKKRVHKALSEISNEMTPFKMTKKTATKPPLVRRLKLDDCSDIDDFDIDPQPSPSEVSSDSDDPAYESSSSSEDSDCKDLPPKALNPSPSPAKRITRSSKKTSITEKERKNKLVKSSSTKSNVSDVKKVKKISTKKSQKTSLARKLKLGHLSDIDDFDIDPQPKPSEVSSDSDDPAYESPSSSEDSDCEDLPPKALNPSPSPAKRITRSSKKTPLPGKKLIKSSSAKGNEGSLSVIKKAKKNYTKRHSFVKSKKTPATSGKVRLRRDFSFSLPKRTISTSDLPTSPYQLAQEKLHVSAVPDALPCREEQFAQIYSFVEKSLRQHKGGCLYISGVPGTGKTATVHEVIHSLEEGVDEGIVPSFKFVEINGMRLVDPYQCYSNIWKQLSGESTSATHASSQLDKYFSSGRKSKDLVVLLADELDLLCTKKQTVLYNLFDWPQRDKSGLVVLAVANTMDLPERVMINRVNSRLGSTRLTFQPYTFRQLQEIVESRLAGLNIFEGDALQLASRKVAAVSGDARRALNICRRATELAEERHREQHSASLVGLQDIEEAVKEMFTSPKIQAIRMASQNEQLFLKAILAENRRSGLEETTFERIFKQIVAISLIEGNEPPTTSASLELCLRLYHCRLILLEANGKLDLLQKIRLNISQDDVIFALQQQC